MLIIMFLAAFAGYMIYSYFNTQEQNFDREGWLRMRDEPGWSRENQAEEDLEEVLENAKDYWKKYM